MFCKKNFTLAALHVITPDYSLSLSIICLFVNKTSYTEQAKLELFLQELRRSNLS